MKGEVMKPKEISEELIEEFKEYFFEDILAGKLYWKKNRPGPGGNIGSEAGCFDSYGYRFFKFKGILYKSHRVIWCLSNGPIPDGYQIDHRDNNPSNNRLSNLRLVTPSQNQMNSKPHRDNQLGIKGISKSPYGFGFIANIQKDGVIKIKRFKHLNDAVAWRQEKEQELHGAFSYSISQGV